MKIKEIDINPEVRVMNLGNQKMVVEGDFKKIMILNQSSNRILELLYQEKDIERAKKQWLDEMNLNVVGKEEAEHDFYNFVDELVKNRYIKEI